MIDKKKVKIEKAAPEVKDESGKYLYAVGKRKTAIAQVRIYPTDTSTDVLVNGKKLELYFSVARFADMVKSALTSVGLSEKFNVTVKVAGGGINAQAEAIRLGISRALIKFDKTLRKVLKAEGFLTRDARVVERKKPGLKKARKSPQWAKR